MAEIDAHKTKCQNVQQRLRELKLSVKIAFDADEATPTTGLKSTCRTRQADLVVGKLEEFHISQQLVSIPNAFSILISLDAPQVTRTFVLHEVAKLQVHLAEKVAENKKLIDQNTGLTAAKNALTIAQK